MGKVRETGGGVFEMSIEHPSIRKSIASHCLLDAYQGYAECVT